MHGPRASEGSKRLAKVVGDGEAAKMRPHTSVHGDTHPRVKSTRKCVLNTLQRMVAGWEGC
jgi:hypothetical protein